MSNSTRSDTYEKPPHGWTCFHCGETFKNTGEARDHFGAKPDALPGCMLRVSLGGERGLLMALRRVEEELAQMYLDRADEDTRLHRELHRLQSRHSDALQTAEETGYARGLAAVRPDAVVVNIAQGSNAGKHIEITDRLGVMAAATMRRYFEGAVTQTHALAASVPLDRVAVAGEFREYMRPETQAMWLGFALGMRCAERVAAAASLHSEGS